MTIRRFALLISSLVFLLTVFTSAAQCKVIYVSTSGSDTNDGLSWAAAKKTVTAGINASVADDEIWVASGQYTEHITLKVGVSLYGGFAGNETDRNQRDYRTNKTILESNKVTPVITVPSGTTNATSIDGFTIKNGYSGISCNSASISIANNIITGNTGGGIHCTSSSAPIIMSNTISGNSGITNVGASEFNYGGGIYCNNSSPVISNNIIAGNGAIKGGGIYCTTSSPIISNNTISGNIATFSGGGISCNTKSSPIISNNIIAFNSTGIYADTGSNPDLHNNDIYNTSGYNYSGLTSGNGDIQKDPMFVSYTYGNYHIQPDSPCVNAGWNDASNTVTTDIDGQARISPEDGVIDIGADESDGKSWDNTLPLIVRVDGTNGNDANDGSSWQLAKKTVQAGIDAASASGGEVWVKAGTYNELITLKNNAFVYGGFEGTEETRDARNWLRNRTILDGGGNNGPSVVTALGIGWHLASIDGFIIRNSNCNGILCQYASPIISHNIITNISGYPGNGIYCNYDSSTILNNIITKNVGSGIHCESSTSIISNNTIVANSAYNGGGIFCSHCTLTVSNNLIVRNSSGIRSDSGSVILRNNNVFNSVCEDYQAISAGTGDISVDPKFVSYVEDNYHIQPDSPCVNAGWNDASNTSTTDIDGQARILPEDGVIDIGADESDGKAWDNTLPLIVRVDGTNGNDANDGSSWQLAKKTVQAAIDTVSTSVGEVWVKAGTYNELITLKNNAFLYGGFAGTEFARDTRNWTINKTILDGGANGSVVTARDIPWGHSSIDGFTIRNGNATNGGGIACENAWPNISNNVLTGNKASQYGGGIYCHTSLTTSASQNICNNTILNNTSSSGGGICYWSQCGKIVISNNTIDGNKASQCGGGVYIQPSGSPNYSFFTLSNNIISNNSAGPSSAPYRISGGGISISPCAKAAVLGNIVTNNTSTGVGGGLYCGDYCITTISNNTFAGNKYSGVYLDQCYSTKVSNNIIGFNFVLYLNLAGIVNNNTSQLILQNNDVFNPGGANYSGLSAGTGDISKDPMFVNRNTGDYHLSPLSPCINAGWNDAAEILTFDIDNESRIMAETIDIGADEAACVTKIWGSKQLTDGVNLDIASAIVTAAFKDYFYIESDDRSNGIRVNFSGHTLTTGMRAHVIGSVQTNSDGERYIQATIADQVDTGTLIPLGIAPRSVGGGQCGLQVGVWPNGIGANNIGLLIKTWGKVTYADTNYFYIDDGSSLDDNSGHRGVKVYGSVPVDAGVDPVGKMVSVTGISSCEKPGTSPIRVIRTRSTSDVVVIETD